jgi:integrase
MEVPMRAGCNSNHPKKGDRIAVEPIRDIKNIKTIAKMISGNPRNHLLFIMGINNGLRAGDLVKLGVKQVRYLKIGDTLTIKEGKTGKDNILVINKTVFKALQNYLDTVKPDDDAFLFASRKGNSHIQSQAVSKMVKRWAEDINLEGNYGAHTLRKTWGYIQRTVHGVGFEIICKRYNHSSPAITMRYLGIQDKEVHNVLMNEVG